MARAFIDLHCHTRASFDSTAKPADVARAAHARGLTHLVVSDHDRIDGALAARDAAPAGLTVIVGEEVKTTDGDLICAYLRSAIPPGLSPEETIAAAREQGGLVGIPHPFDRMRGSLPAGRARWPRSRRSSTGSRPTTPVSSATATTRPPSTRSSTDSPRWPSRTPTRCSRSAWPRPRSTATRRHRPGSWRRCRRPSSSSAGPRTSSASGPRSRRASSGPAATAGSARGPGSDAPVGHPR